MSFAETIVGLIIAIYTVGVCVFMTFYTFFEKGIGKMWSILFASLAMVSSIFIVYFAYNMGWIQLCQ